MKISKRQLRQIIREEKTKLAARRRRRQRPMVESMDSIKSGMASFMDMMDGNVEAFAAWLEKNPKIKEKIDYALTPHKAGDAAKNEVRKIINRVLREDAIDTELDHLKDNVHDDIEHIRDLKDDIKDDHEEERRAEAEKRRHDESVRRRSLKNRLRRVIRGR